MEMQSHKKVVVNPEEAANIRLMFEMYAQPTTSYGDITPYFANRGFCSMAKSSYAPLCWRRCYAIRSHVQADLDVYEFFKLRYSHCQ